MKPLYIKKNGVINKVGGIGMPTSYPADDVEYDNTTSGLTGDTVQEAIDEIIATGAGRGITSVTINSSNHLIITYTDGTTSDAGEIPTGQDGNSTSY